MIGSSSHAASSAAYYASYLKDRTLDRAHWLVESVIAFSPGPTYIAWALNQKEKERHLIFRPEIIQEEAVSPTARNSTGGPALVPMPGSVARWCASPKSRCRPFVTLKFVFASTRSRMTDPGRRCLRRSRVQPMDSSQCAAHFQVCTPHPPHSALLPRRRS